MQTVLASLALVCEGRLWDFLVFPDEREFVWLFSFRSALVFFAPFTRINSIIHLLCIKHDCCRSLIFPASTPKIPSGYQVLLSGSVPETCVSVTTRGCSEQLLPLSASLVAESIAQVLPRQTLL